MHTAKVTSVGETVAIAIPPEIAARLHFSNGDEVEISETEDGFHVICNKGQLADQMCVAEAIMEKRRDVLRRLAE